MKSLGKDGNFFPEKFGKPQTNFCMSPVKATVRRENRSEWRKIDHSVVNSRSHVDCYFSMICLYRPPHQNW